MDGLDRLWLGTKVWVETIWDETFGDTREMDDDWLVWVFEVCCIGFQGWMYLLVRGFIGCCFRFQKHRGNGTLVADHLETSSIF
jgi:hypothetical protein